MKYIIMVLMVLNNTSCLIQVYQRRDLFREKIPILQKHLLKNKLKTNSGYYVSSEYDDDVMYLKSGITQNTWEIKQVKKKMILKFDSIYNVAYRNAYVYDSLDETKIQIDSKDLYGWNPWNLFRIVSLREDTLILHAYSYGVFNLYYKTFFRYFDIGFIGFFIYPTVRMLEVQKYKIINDTTLRHIGYSPYIYSEYKKVWIDDHTTDIFKYNSNEFLPDFSKNFFYTNKSYLRYCERIRKKELKKDIKNNQN